MLEAITKFYRRLLKNGFEYIGSLENPSIFLDSITEKIPVCGEVGQDHLHLYINIRESVIEDVKYMCTCDPIANVGIEIMCALIKGKTLIETKAITENDFARFLACEDEEFLERAKDFLRLLNRGITRFEENPTAVQLSERN